LETPVVLSHREKTGGYTGAMSVRQTNDGVSPDRIGMALER